MTRTREWPEIAVFKSTSIPRALHTPGSELRVLDSLGTREGPINEWLIKKGTLINPNWTHSLLLFARYFPVMRLSILCATAKSSLRQARYFVFPYFPFLSLGRYYINMSIHHRLMHQNARHALPSCNFQLPNVNCSRNEAVALRMDQKLHNSNNNFVTSSNSWSVDSNEKTAEAAHSMELESISSTKRLFDVRDNSLHFP